MGDEKQADLAAEKHEDYEGGEGHVGLEAGRESEVEEEDEEEGEGGDDGDEGEGVEEGALELVPEGVGGGLGVPDGGDGGVYDLAV